ncbi:hypothetical protein [Streptomyces jumonjinensis]|uniref:hypothetical protein n=1 Tax=Streptomyces jumonjinensis TaxID=1945 RepID=UPI003792B31D
MAAAALAVTLFAPKVWLLLLIAVAFVLSLASCWSLSRLEHSSRPRPGRVRRPSPRDEVNPPPRLP